MRKPKLSKATCEKLMDGESVKKGKYLYEVWSSWNEELKAYEEILERWSNNGGYEEFKIGYKGIWEYCKE